MADPGRYFEENVGGTAALLRAAVDAGVAHVVFSSSAAVYGTPQRVPIDEDHPLHPESPCGETKVLVERMAVEHLAGGGVGRAQPRHRRGRGTPPIPTATGSNAASDVQGRAQSRAKSRSVRRDGVVPPRRLSPAWRGQRRPKSAVTKRVMTCSMVANRITMSSDTDQFST